MTTPATMPTVKGTQFHVATFFTSIKVIGFESKEHMEALH